MNPENPYAGWTQAELAAEMKRIWQVVAEYNRENRYLYIIYDEELAKENLFL